MDLENLTNAIDALNTHMATEQLIDLTHTCYSGARMKCIALFTSNDATNNDIIAREMRDTQNFIFAFILAHKNICVDGWTKRAKKFVCEHKYKITQELYEVAKECKSI